MSFFNRLGRSAALIAVGAGSLMAADVQIPRIAYESFTLDNGLRVMVHEDRKAPIVAFNVWYHVGSKNEKPGRTGFAHLFEHLMFNGSQHHNTDYFKVLEKIGATDLNGTTNQDRTNYFENVPTSALDTLLWMESDRMGYMTGAIDKAKLDEQRGVVQNEKRQGENRPYGMVYETLLKHTFPANHPYSWTVIGSMEDLSAASVNDAHEWFKSYYGPNNAVVVLAGDIDVKTAKEKMQKYFGALPASAPLSRPKAWVPKMTGSKRYVMQDKVPQAMLMMAWNTPELVAADAQYLDLLGGVLGGGNTSRLYRRLVEKEQLATSASAYGNAQEISGQFHIQIMARPGADLAKIEKIAKEELDNLLAQGPTEDELKRLKSRYYAAYVRGMERIGGFGGKSDILASSLVLAGDPDFERTSLIRQMEAAPSTVKAAGQRWLTDGCFTLEVHPTGNLKAAAQDADRTQMPQPGETPALKLPKFQRATLSNGLQVVLAERNEAPIVEFRMIMKGGTAVDSKLQSGAGTASIAMKMLAEGTKTRTSHAFREEMESLGASLSAGASTNTFRVNMSALKANLEPSVNLFADMILHPAFPADAFARIQKNTLTAIAQEKNNPNAMAARVSAPVLFGKDHPYGAPLTGSGYESTVSKLKAQDLSSMHQAWFKPGSATLIVAGNVTLNELKPVLEKAFATWPKGSAPKLEIPKVANAGQSTIYLVDKPGAIQSVVQMVAVAPERSEKDEAAVEAMQQVLGGMFTSRVNMNLREEKGWTYGAGVGLASTQSVRRFMASTSVQLDKTKETILELEKEMKGIRGEKPVTHEELTFAQKNMTQSLPGSYETAASVCGAIEDIITWDLQDNYFNAQVERVKALKSEDLMKAAQKIVPEKGRSYVVVGDRTKIESELKSLNLGEVKVVDADGNPV